MHQFGKISLVDPRVMVPCCVRTCAAKRAPAQVPLRGALDQRVRSCAESCAANTFSCAQRPSPIALVRGSTSSHGPLAHPLDASGALVWALLRAGACRVTRKRSAHAVHGAAYTSRWSSGWALAARMVVLRIARALRGAATPDELRRRDEEGPVIRAARAGEVARLRGVLAIFLSTVEGILALRESPGLFRNLVAREELGVVPRRWPKEVKQELLASTGSMAGQQASPQMLVGMVSSTATRPATTKTLRRATVATPVPCSQAGGAKVSRRSVSSPGRFSLPASITPA